MDDLPDREPPRFWIAVSIFVVALALTVFMLVYNTVRAEAQQQCPPLSALVEELGTKYGERIVWEGTAPTPQGAFEIMMFQSPKGTWTIVQVQGTQACMFAAGKDGTPIERELPGEDA